MLAELFSQTPWWGYLICAVLAVVFGVLQAALLSRAVFDKPPRRWLLAVKLALWAAAFTLSALVSIPVLLVFALASTLSMLCRALFIAQKARKEAE